MEDPEEPDDSAAFFRALGKQIKLLREQRGLTQRQLADRIGYSEDLVSSVERGRRIPQPEYLATVDRAVEAGGLLSVTTEEVARAKANVKHPAFFRTYAKLETCAVEMHEFSIQNIPGLLQTEEHARAVFSLRRPLLPEQIIEERVVARMARQEVLEKWPPPEATWIIEEAVLHRPVGGREIHGRQLEKLLRVGRKRNVELQVMPLARTEHAGLGGPFNLLTPKGRPQIGYIEAQSFSHLIRDPEVVRILAAQYGSLRAQALTPAESLSLIEKMLGDL
ncbi:Scr1 family TA system antitoxin-like transcriptional regulator [Kitasatospora sp. NPDC058965]|uniref:helix-turn-helix domain-containing protein n=1 Tax=Kitasatospora sp. NPDC058965 TaxID=3346682 RepID=UPI00368795C8